MPFYRLYLYPMRKKPYRHLYFPRNRIGSKKDGFSSSSEKAESIEYDKKLDESLSRSRRTVRDLIYCNKFDMFCTFTFNQERVDRFNYKECQKKITKVFDNYKNRYSPEFKYVIVPEFHKNGAVHFHGMVRGIRENDLSVPDYIWKRNLRNNELILVPNTRKYVDWTYYSKKLGFFSCSLVKNQAACAIYVSKYITKDLAGLPKGVRAVMSSKGLARPELVFDEDDVPFLPEQVDFQNEHVRITDSYDHYGLVPDWYGELCSDLADLPDMEGEEAVRDVALFPRLTGNQLSLCDLSNSEVDVFSMTKTKA